LGAKTITSVSKNGLDFLANSPSNFDWVFIDPSRRNEIKGKVFLLEDCLPNVPKNLDQIFTKTSNVLLKTSPLLDIAQGLKELNFVKGIHVLAINNEVKELLWILKKGFHGQVAITTVNLKNDGTEKFSFYRNEEVENSATIGLPEKYLYEPNAAVLKSGAFKTIGQQFGIRKLHLHSHLYTSDKLMAFPGRSFKIEKVVPYSKKNIRSLGFSKANITTRNFPLTVAQIRNKHNIKDGSEVYLFFTTLSKNEGVTIHCSKV